MDAPPHKESCDIFLHAAKIFHEMGVNVPKIIDKNISNGFILMEDFGSKHYLDIVKENPSKKKSLYSDAIETLLHLQTKGENYHNNFPFYTRDLIRKEILLFVEWFLTIKLGYELTESEKEQFEVCISILIDNALEQPQVLVHRDYHSRNLMVLSSGSPGVLDFQDAVIGPITYDLVSLLRDCYISLSPDLIELLFDKFYENLNENIRNNYSKNRFKKFFDLMGIQRHLKAIGIFTRLNYRDGKQNYLKDIPRTLNYIYHVSENYKELNFLRELIANIK
jgi:aminoglycoside/choline kinase family phosphotransferase